MWQFIKVNIFNLVGIAIGAAAFVYIATHFDECAAAVTVLLKL